MPKETIASVRAEYEEALALRDQIVAHTRDQRDRAINGMEALGKARDSAEDRARTAERNAVDARAERDVLRGFIFREIPVRLDSLPGPLQSALGLYVGA